MKAPLLPLLAAALLAPALPAPACTSLLLKTSDGGYVYGRTMEFGFELQSAAVVLPRQLAFTATGPDGKPGLAWKGQYAVAGMNAFGLPIVVDGVNEKGLAGGTLYFPEYAVYTSAASATPAKSVAPWEFLTWALTNFATVAEVKAALSDVEIVSVILPQFGAVPPFHYTLHDAGGQSIVIEPVGGRLVVYDNPFGVMTNSPSFDWHLTNLKNYVKLSPENAPPLQIGSQTITSFGEGSGWLGIPGDGTPPSRFVRALAFSLTSIAQPAGPESVRLVEHIMNNFDIPKGQIRQASSVADYTQWTGIADLRHRRYYLKTYDDQTLRCIDLPGCDLTASQMISAPVPPKLDPPTLLPAKK